jgi:hypothetical protein
MGALSIQQENHRPLFKFLLFLFEHILPSLKENIENIQTSFDLRHTTKGFLITVVPSLLWFPFPRYWLITVNHGPKT